MTDNTNCLFSKLQSLTMECFNYGIVAVIAFAVDFSTLYVLTKYLGIHYLISNVFGFLFGVIVNYILSVKWVFRNKRNSSGYKEFITFFAIGVGGIMLNELIMWSVTEYFAWHYTHSKLLATVIMFFYNFGVRKALLFRGNKI